MTKIFLILVALLCGVGHGGLVKMCAALNCPPPSNEEYFSNTLRHIQPALSTARHRSCASATEEAIVKQGTRDITVSTDGTWQKRGFSSTHGVVAVISSNDAPKVLDAQRLSKRCSKCIGVLAIKESNPMKYQQVMASHDCEKNFEGASG
jgi:hypothetical protein